MVLQDFIDSIIKEKTNLLNLLKAKKVALITHANCLDGAGCKIATDYFLGESKVDTYFAGYHNIDEMITNVREKYETIIVADISPSVEFVIASPNIILIDHHDTAEKFANNKTRFYNNSKSGAYLVNEFFKTLSGKESKIQDFINIIDDYDRYILQDERSKQLAKLFIEANRAWFFEEFKSPTNKFEVTDLYQKIINRNIIKLKEAANDTITFVPKDSKVIFTILNRQFVNEISEALLQKYRCVCSFIPFLDKEYYSISIRQESNSKLNLAKFLEAVFKDGGGHADAAGVRIKSNQEDLKNFVNTMMKVYSDENYDKIPERFLK